MPSAPDSPIAGGPADPTLARLIERWPSLPGSAKREIATVLDTHADAVRRAPSEGKQ